MLLITFYEILIRMCRIQRTLTVGNVGPFLRDEATLMVSRDAGLTWDMVSDQSAVTHSDQF